MASTDVTVPAARPAVWMAARVQQRHQRFGRDDRGVVLILAERRDDRRPARLDLVGRK